MQRVTQEPERTRHDFADLLNVIAILRRHFPPSIANIFAVPREVGQTLQWWTELEGQPISFKELSSSAQNQLLAVLEGRLTGIDSLAKKLDSDGNVVDATVLKNLLSQSIDYYEQLWSLDNEPLIAMWGQRSAPSLVTAIPHFNATAISVMRQPSYRGWWWLWLFLASSLVASLYYLWPEETQQANFSPNETDLPYACRKNVDPPDFVIVLDTSSSMSLNINVSEIEEKWMFSPHNKSTKSFQDIRRIKAALAEPKRISVAKEALFQVINGLHADIPINLITFGLCGKTYHQGLFGPDDRAQLIKTIQSLSSKNETPIAQSLRHAASLVDGKEKDAIIILFVDGGDGCKQDVCEVSRILAQEKPKMRVNIVNISDRILSNCIAENTGGRVYAAKDAEQLRILLNSAAREVMSTSVCPN